MAGDHHFFVDEAGQRVRAVAGLRSGVLYALDDVGAVGVGGEGALVPVLAMGVRWWARVCELCGCPVCALAVDGWRSAACARARTGDLMNGNTTTKPCEAYLRARGRGCDVWGAIRGAVLMLCAVVW